MSHPHGQGFPNPVEDMHAYYQALGIEWTGVNTPPSYPYTDINQAYCSAPMAYPDTLTPVSLVDSSVGPSPAISHRSQEIHPQDYRYVNDPIVQPQGLGISAPFPSEYPRTTAPSQINYAYAPDHSHYNLGQTPGASPIAPPPKRMKRTPSKTPSRDTPVNILPHPEGMELMERARENRKSQPPPPIMPPKPRASGRGRRDPQADAEDAFVENLREKGYAWKIVRDMFCAHFNKEVSEATLQMRLKRRKNQRNQWEDADVQLLINAHESWEREKYQVIADKIKEMGCKKRYTPEQCKQQLQLLEEKRSLEETGRESPTTSSDPPTSPPVPSSRKRRREPAEQ